MSYNGFMRCLDVAWRPTNDGQCLHTTPGDAGGATRMGITFHNFVAWRTQHHLPEPSLADFAAAPLSELADIAHAWIWLPIAGDRMPIGVDLVLFETAFGSGPARAAELVQKALDLPQTRRMDDYTVAMAQGQAPAVLISKLTAVHQAYVDALPDAAEFERGWNKRIQADQATALAWLAGTTHVAA